MKIGSIHGRFQPFHNEHLEYALAALELCDYLWIGITQYDIEELKKCQTSPNRSSLTANPLTYIERVKIITDALKDAKVDKSRFAFVPFPIDEPDKLYQFVDKNTVCYTTVREEWNRAKVERLIASGYDVHVLWENLGDKKISSTLIRDYLISGDESWKAMVQPSTIENLLSLGICERLQSIK